MLIGAYIVFGLILSFLTVMSNDSSIRTELNPVGQELPTGCELNVAVLDGLAQKAEGDDLIIVVARLGRNETKTNLNRRRLHNVLIYLTEFLTDGRVRRKPKTIVLAEGEKSHDSGRIELYLKGKLFDVLRVKRNADLPVGYCALEPPEKPCPAEERNLYPCRDRFNRLRK